MIRFVGGEWDGKEIRECFAAEKLIGPFAGRYELRHVAFVDDAGDLRARLEYIHYP